MTTTHLRIRITEKATRRTAVAIWPWENGIALCFLTGYKQLIYPGRCGYSEYNERNEPVLDSWIEELNLFNPKF